MPYVPYIQPGQGQGQNNQYQTLMTLLLLQQMQNQGQGKEKEAGLPDVGKSISKAKGLLTKLGVIGGGTGTAAALSGGSSTLPALVSSPAELALYNAGATSAGGGLATTGATGGLGVGGGAAGGAEAAGSGLGSLSTLGPLAATAIGTVLAGKAGYDMSRGKKPNAPGRAQLAVSTGGISEIAKKFLGLGGGDEFKREQKRRQALRDQGFNLPQNETDSLSKGRSKDELVELAKKTGGNVEFANSRDENLLGGKDLVGYSFLPEKFGKEFANASLDKRISAAQMIADAKAAREHHGTMDYNNNLTPELEAKIKSFLSQPGANGGNTDMKNNKLKGAPGYGAWDVNKAATEALKKKMPSVPGSIGDAMNFMDMGLGLTPQGAPPLKTNSTMGPGIEYIANMFSGSKPNPIGREVGFSGRPNVAQLSNNLKGAPGFNADDAKYADIFRQAEQLFNNAKSAPSPTRTKTRSPGIDMNGNRIKY